MFSIVLITLFGVLIGYLLRRFSVVRVVNRTLTWTIWFMLFVLGLGVGRNTLTADGFIRYGGEALLIAAVSVFGSLIATKIVTRYMIKTKEDKA